MKKYVLFTIIIFILILPLGVFAYNPGDIMGKADYSGIDTYINNFPINAYCYNDYQIICAEDLRDYGFSVLWDGEARTLSITPDYSVQNINGQPDIKKKYYMQNKKAYNIFYSDIKVYLNGNEIPGYSVNGLMMIKLRELASLGTVEYDDSARCSKVWVEGLPQTEFSEIPIDYETKPVVVLDPGHGKSSGLMSDEEKIAEGYTFYNGQWGEWRHFKSGTYGTECMGSGCNKNSTCFYPMANGNRSTEPDLNLRAAQRAKYYLENELGYIVRMTRESANDNPSFTKRVSYCHPNRDMTTTPDASCYVCIHSNAGGGRGSAYIEAGNNYDQLGIDGQYVNDSNKLGQFINNRITTETSLSNCGSGKISGMGYLILFNKCIVPAGYLEIGFYDSADLSILNSEYDAIGRAIAYGINDYLNS